MSSVFLVVSILALFVLLGAMTRHQFAQRILMVYIGLVVVVLLVTLFFAWRGGSP